MIDLVSNSFQVAKKPYFLDCLITDRSVWERWDDMALSTREECREAARIAKWAQVCEFAKIVGFVIGGVILTLATTAILLGTGEFVLRCMDHLNQILVEFSVDLWRALLELGIDLFILNVICGLIVIALFCAPALLTPFAVVCTTALIWSREFIPAIQNSWDYCAHLQGQIDVIHNKAGTINGS